ncbi:darcynin family protein [Agrobacterium sp. V1]|uniref:darcynin family protein n=1 Tax=Agrobacterium sp. V1 TaxID=3061957 RepID=UPI0034A00802
MACLASPWRRWQFAFGKQVLDPILARYTAARMAFYDSGAFTADCTDVMVWTVTSLDDYNGAVNDSRETKFGASIL